MSLPYIGIPFIDTHKEGTLCKWIICNFTYRFRYWWWLRAVSASERFPLVHDRGYSDFGGSNASVGIDKKNSAREVYIPSTIISHPTSHHPHQEHLQGYQIFPCDRY